MSTDLATTSPIPALDFRALAEEVARQPDLFAAISGSVADQEIVRAARERRYHGGRVPEARAAQIVALRVTGASLREIERQTGADHRTIKAVVRCAEEQGMVPALKEVVARRMLELAEKTADIVDRELDSDEPDAQLIKAGWVGIGIAADKAAAASAPAPQLHLHAHLGVGDQDPASIYAAMLRSADAESAVSSRNPLQPRSAFPADTVLDVPATSAGAPGNQAATLARAQDPLAVGDREAVLDRGAGGVANGGPAGSGDGTP